MKCEADYIGSKQNELDEWNESQCLATSHTYEHAHAHQLYCAVVANTLHFLQIEVNGWLDINPKAYILELSAGAGTWIASLQC